MVITGIQIKNFKGFEFTQIIELKPITLIFGDNSSGKSTITQALQYVREILLRGNVNPDKTTLGGETIDLGGFRNFVNKKDISKEITLRINWDGSRTDMPEYISPYLGSDNADMENHNLDFNDMLNNYIPNFTPNGWIEFEIAWSELKEEPYLKTYEIGYGDEILGIIDSSHDTGKTQISFLNFGHKIFSLSQASSDSSFMEVPEYFDELVGFKDLTISNIKEICFREGTFFPVKTLYNQHQGTGKEVIARLTEMKDSEGNTLSEGEAEKRKRQIDGIENSLQLKALSTIGNQVSISLSNLLTPLPETGQQLHLGDNFSEDAEDQGITIMQAIINFLFVAPLDILRDSFSPMCYIGPLRAVPGRDYKPQLSPSPEEYNWANGLAAYDILYHSSSQFINEVNKWLKEGHINLGYQIKLEKYKKIESDGWLFGNLRMALDENDGFIPFSAEEFHEYIRDAQEIKELTLRENNTGLAVSLHEIGVGVSQVLPLIVASIYMKQKIHAIHCPYNVLIFEQPELHVHPKLQVELGDLFISQILTTPQETLDTSYNTTAHPQFIIETHSEHLVLRLLRRIRETTQGKLEPGAPELTNEDIRIYFTEKLDDGSSVISCQNINENGKFIDPWPGDGFFKERGKELFS